MRGAIISYLGTKIVIICILFLHTMLTILYLLEWNSANQKFKNYANPTNLANFLDADDASLLLKWSTIPLHTC